MAFYPLQHLSQTINVTLTTAATALTPISGVTTALNVTYEIQNNGTVPVFMAIGTSAITTSVAAGYPILPGQSKVIDTLNNVDANTAPHIAFISGTTGQTVFITPGYGQ